jgi:hypothetical protein
MAHQPCPVFCGGPQDYESIKRLREGEIAKEQKTNFATNKIRKKKERNKKKYS